MLKKTARKLYMIPSTRKGSLMKFCLAPTSRMMYISFFLEKMVNLRALMNIKIPPNEKIIIIQKPSRIPGNHKNPAGHHNAEHFGKAVEQEIAVKTGGI